MRKRRGWLRHVTLAGDAVAIVAAYLAALLMRFGWHLADGRHALALTDWSLAMVLACTLVAYLAMGLYKREAYLLCTLHVFTLLKATIVGFVATALVVYLLKSPVVQQSRFVLVLTFMLIFGLVVAWRIGLVTPKYFRRLAARRPRTLVVGASLESEMLVARLERLRGFSDVHVVDPLGPDDAQGIAARAIVDSAGRTERPVDNVFFDTASLTPRVTLELVEAAKALQVEVYVVSRILSPLDSTKLLVELFDQPVVRVRRHPQERRARLSKRVFDISGAAILLLVLTPFLALIALAAKLSSPGPVFHVQERVGLKGRTFRFYKFRSMVVNNDHELHRDFVCRLIDGETVCEPGEEGDKRNGVTHKIVDDPRVTRVGAVLRTYSLDELPQFWHVLTGDMSLVGPRPALPYEVERYQPWHRQRLDSVPGVSGLWQVAGRSRVDFDDMVLEDVMYTYNQGVLTDVGICLRTVPAVLFGRGAA